MTRSLTISMVFAAVVLGTATVSAIVTACPAGADTCASGCRARHNQCRIATKGSSSCDAQLRACLQGCLRGRQR